MIQARRPLIVVGRLGELVGVGIGPVLSARLLGSGYRPRTLWATGFSGT